MSALLDAAGEIIEWFGSATDVTERHENESRLRFLDALGKETARSADADTKRIMKAIVALLPDEAREHKKPTREELLRTFPPGYKGDPEKESSRRPGTD